MHQRLDAALDAEAPGVPGALCGGRRLAAALVVQAQAQLVHLVLVVLGVVAGDAKVVVLGGGGQDRDTIVVLVRDAGLDGTLTIQSFISYYTMKSSLIVHQTAISF